MEGTFVDNEALQRFEFTLGNCNAFLQYKKSAGRLLLLHTEVDEECRGHGVGSAFLQRVMPYISEKGHTIVVFCGFVKHFIEVHSEWASLIDPHVHPKT